MSSPEQIQQQIEETRSHLSGHVDRLEEKVAPGKVVGRQVDSIKGSASSLRNRFMGSADSGSGLRGAADSLSSSASGLGSAAGSAPDAIRGQTQGNPLAVGLIAFGVGWLLSSAAPASQPERDMAQTAEAKAKELAEPLKQTGQEMAENLKAPAQQAVEQVKDTATTAAQDTTEHARSAAQDVKDTAAQ